MRKLVRLRLPEKARGQHAGLFAVFLVFLGELCESRAAGLPASASTGCQLGPKNLYDGPVARQPRVVAQRCRGAMSFTGAWWSNSSARHPKAKARVD